MKTKSLPPLPTFGEIRRRRRNAQLWEEERRRELQPAVEQQLRILEQAQEEDARDWRRLHGVPEPERETQP